ncbi:MAG: bifunctional phosphoribosylaminoimidazolecarboxamide formyltransferase/IMP cyclohydrolase [Acidimicrobiales bacterium]
MRALISVSDKRSLVAFARELEKLGVEIIASGGTAEALAKEKVVHRRVEDVTGQKEMLGGRVKTLHPAIHAGILADRDDAVHLGELEREGFEPIDLVVCNLYPFESAPSIGLIDIGGPTMVRSAAKNHAHVGVVVDPDDYAVVIDELRREGALSAQTRRRLATAAFSHVAAYDAAIANWLLAEDSNDLPPAVHLALLRRETLRYGENPHQRAARYESSGQPSWWDGVVQHSGRELSFLNLVDAEAAWTICHSVVGIGGADKGAVIVKHANPCGVAIGTDAADAYAKAFAADEVSAFGGIIAISAVVDVTLSEAIVENPLADVLVAPGFSPAALALFAAKRKNMRVLEAPSPESSQLCFRGFAGGFLIQDRDVVAARGDAWRVVTSRTPTDNEWLDAELAWRVCASTGSNAIVLAKDGVVVGVGCGQQNRRDAARLAQEKAAGRAEGGAGASDAFFPFRDGLDAVCDAGVAVVVEPGGSLRDDEVIAAADERGVALVMTGERHFRH